MSTIHFTPKAGEWFRPERSFKLACCDCGLVHIMNVRLVPNDRGPGKKIEWQAFRDERATATQRRRMQWQTAA